MYDQHRFTICTSLEMWGRVRGLSWSDIASPIGCLFLGKEITIVKCSSSLRNVDMWINYKGSESTGPGVGEMASAPPLCFTSKLTHRCY